MTVVSILIPAYNEEATIITVLEAVQRQTIPGFEFQVIVIDDGSADGTVAKLQARDELFDKLVINEVNGGKGAAIVAGLGHATGDYVLFQDADLEYSPDEYKDLFFPIDAFEADVVLGSRFLAPKYSRVHYFWNMLGNKFITILFNLMNNTTFTDIYSCYLVYRRTLLEPKNLKSRGWEQHAEILSSVVKRAKVVYEVPISYHGRSYEEGKKIRAHHVIGVILMILRKRFSTD